MSNYCQGCKDRQDRIDALHKAITALMPFLMEDYDYGIMTPKYKAAIEDAIEATDTEAQDAS